MSLFKSSAKIGLMIIAIISLNFSFIDFAKAANYSRGVVESYFLNPYYQDQPNYLLANVSIVNTENGNWEYYGITKDTVFPEGFSYQGNTLGEGDVLKIEYTTDRIEGIKEEYQSIYKKAVKISFLPENERPDLTIEDYLTFEPGEVQYRLDDSYYITFKAINNGQYNYYIQNSINFKDSFSYTIKDAGGNIKEQKSHGYYLELIAGQAKNESLYIKKDKLSVGDSLTIKIDPLNAVAEKDESNNEKTFTITQSLIDQSGQNEEPVQSSELPDLIISFISYDPSIQTSQVVKYGTKNIGKNDLAGSFKDVTVSIKITDKDGKVVRSINENHAYMTLKINQETTHYPSFTLKEGDTITMTVDSKSTVKESDENNNTKTVTVTFGNKAFEPKTSAEAKKILNNLKGKIVLQVEQKGEAYYYSPKTSKIHYLKDGASAYQIMRETGLGISEADYADLISTSDKGQQLKKRLAGNIVLRVQKKGEAYYINPSTLKLTYLADGSSAYRIMKEQSTGIADKDLSKIINLDIYKDWEKYANSEAGVSFYYPKSTDYKLDVEITDLKDYPAGPWGDGKQNALADQAALAKGQYGRNISWFDPYQSVVKLAGGVNAKQYTSLGAFDVCDIHFSKALIFYHNNKEIYIHFVIDPGDYDFHSAGYDKIYKEMSQYFVNDKNNCPDLMWIPDEGPKDFLTDLKNHRGKGLAQEWTNNFKKIIESIELK